MTLSYLPPIIIFLGVLVGISSQKKWISENKGLKKLTPTGWAALILGIIGLALAIKDINTKREQEKLFNASLGSDIRQAYVTLLFPFDVIYLKTHPNLREKNASPVPAGVARERLFNKVPVDSLLTADFINVLCNYSTKEIMFYKKPGQPFYNVLQDCATDGKDQLEQIILRKNNFLSVRQNNLLDAIVRDTFINSLIQRPVIINDPTMNKYAGETYAVLSRDDSSVELYKNFMRKIIDLTNLQK